MHRVIAKGPRAASMAGITLIELLTVVMIIGILAAIAVPAYRSYSLKTNRRAAQACLSEAAQAMERYYTTNLTYVGATAAPGCAADGNMITHYTFSTSGLTQNTYKVVASAIGPQLKDTQCATLKINQSGSKTPTTSGCW